MPAHQRPPRAIELTDEEWLALLESGAVEVEGRLPWSSNATLLVTITDGTRSGRAVYKPRRGERELWDFPDGLYRREVAAFELDRSLKLGVVPATVLRRDAPFGEGSLQRFVDADYEEHYFTLRESDEHLESLKVVAAFDLLANNADRKGGHLLIDQGGRIWAIDNGLSFHSQPKLRTVMWDFIGESIPPVVAEGAAALVAAVPGALHGLLDDAEVSALVERAKEMVEHPVFPEPEEGSRMPWPLV